MASDTASSETRERFDGSNLWKPWMSEIRLRQAVCCEEVEEFLEQGSGKQRISWDIETESLDPDPNKVVGHCIAFDGNEGMYIPVRHKVGADQNLDPDKVWDMILEAVREPKILIVYNWKFEGECLHRKGMERKAKHSILRDVMIYNWLYDSNEKRLGLKDAVKLHLGLEMLEIDEVPGSKRDKKKRGVIDFSETDPEEATLYAAADPVMTFRLLEKLEKKVLEEQAFICDLEHRLLDPLFALETNAVTINRAFLKQGKKDLLRWINVVTTRILDKAGYDFNIGSTAEVGKFLDAQGIPLNKTKTGKLATSAKEIEKLGPNYPVVQDILLWRSLVKEMSTYVDTLLHYTTDDTPFAVFKFRSVGAPTGRFASGGVGVGESKYVPMNVQSIPSASAFRDAPCWLISNPPIDDMEACLRDGTMNLMLEDDEEGEIKLDADWISDDE